MELAIFPLVIMTDTVMVKEVIYLNAYDDELHEYRIDDVVVPSVTSILRVAGLYQEQYFNEESRRRGKYIHKAILYYLQDDLDIESTPQEYRGYIEAFIRFNNEVKPIIAIGKCEVSKFSTTFRYGGTPDIIASFNNNESIIDLKTGAETPVTGIQLAGYSLLYPDMRLKRYGLYLKADGKYKLIPYQDRNDKNIFMSALSLYNWRSERGLL